MADMHDGWAEVACAHGSEGGVCAWQPCMAAGSRVSVHRNEILIGSEAAPQLSEQKARCWLEGVSS